MRSTKSPPPRRAALDPEVKSVIEVYWGVELEELKVWSDVEGVGSFTGGRDGNIFLPRRLFSIWRFSEENNGGLIDYLSKSSLFLHTSTVS